MFDHPGLSLERLFAVCALDSISALSVALGGVVAEVYLACEGGAALTAVGGEAIAPEGENESINFVQIS